MSDQQSSYRQIFKATSLFGGVQVFSILIGIVRTKFVAILLGTAGAGIMGLFNAPLQLIISVTGLGISMSAVREISEAQGSGDQAKVVTSIITLRRLSLIAGILGMVVTMAFAPLLSKWSFGNSHYTWAFIWLSLTLLLQTVSNGQLAIIQGTRRLNDLAKTTVFSSLIGLFTAVPLFYYYGLKGIVPSLIIAAITGLSMSFYFSRKVTIEPIKMSYRETLSNGREMINLGIVLTITGIVGFLTAYVLSAFINRTGGVDQVGLYNSGWSIIGQSTGLVFTAMATDYFARLAEINKDDTKISILINQQAEMVLLILAPILILLIGAMPIVIRILYTPAFLPVVVFANWMLLGILFKGLVWPVGFIFPAKGNLKLFGLIEISALIFNIITNMIGFQMYGLEGLGITFIINYLFGLTLTLVFAFKKYGIRYAKSTLKQFSISLVCVLSAFLVSYYINKPRSYYYGMLIFAISFIYSFIEIDKRVGLKVIFKDFYDKSIKK